MCSGHWTLRNGDCIEGRIGGERGCKQREDRETGVKMCSKHSTLRNGDCIEGRIGGEREGASRERIGRQGLKCALSTRH